MTSSGTRLAVAVVIIILIIGAGVGLYFLVFKKSGESGENPPPSTTPPPINESFYGTLYMNSGYGEIMKFDLNDGTNETVVDNESYLITTFDYCKKKKTLFYGTTEPDQPILFFGDGQKIELSKSESWIKTAVAVDSVTDKIYVVDGRDSKVYVLDLLNENYKEVLQDLDEPKDVVLDLHHGLMFILQSSSIIQVNMDGSDSSKIVNEPNLGAIAINPHLKEVYYTTSTEVKSYSYAENGKVKSIKLDKNITKLSATSDEIYLVEFQHYPLPDNILRYSIKNNNFNYVPIKPRFIESIKVYVDTDEETMLENPCKVKNGGCQHLCLLTSKDTKYSCNCQEGWELSNDLKNCKKIKGT